MWLSLLLANKKDPGFLPQNTEDYHRSIKQIAYYDEWKNHRGMMCAVMLYVISMVMLQLKERWVWTYYDCVTLVALSDLSGLNIAGKCQAS